MALSESIYDSLEPFTKYPVLASQQHLNTKVDLRPLCLRTDLQSIYDWQNNHSNLSNFHTNSHELSALFFHKKILESVNGQSFLVLKEGKPASLWTITPAQFDSCLNKYKPGVHDKSIEFLMNNHNEIFFEQFLRLVLDICARAKHPGKLFIWLAIPHPFLTSTLSRVGFSRNDVNLNVFFITV